ncbi:MAG: SPOR domain-containing protein [Alphaproteobacteria bacterium]|nr:SPOR domain-containing protein [Alphaproteobacteria bacterium]
MNDQDENLDLLDLDENGDVDTLPEATPFSTPRPRRPWLLMGLGLAIVVLATWIIIVRVGGDSGSSMTVDLDAPVVNVDVPPAPVADLRVPPKPVDVAPQPVERPIPPVVEPKPDFKPEPRPQPQPVVVPPVDENVGAPIRVIEDRKDVTFNPDAGETPPVVKPQPRPKTKPIAKPAKKITPPASKTQAATNGNIYVQFGSYSTRELAQAAERKIRSEHPSLFNGKQFVILAAEVNGKTTYRLRVAFNSAADANGFCRNAKSDGLDCYVAK